jgi:predicted phosphodiesterase
MGDDEKLEERLEALRSSPSIRQAALKLQLDAPSLARYFERRSINPGEYLGTQSPFTKRAGPEVVKVEPRGLTEILICPDVHIPYHDELAWNTFLAAATALRPDILVILGDAADCYEISDFVKNPARKHDFESEMAAVNVELDRVDALRIPRVVFLEGNHEDRLNRLIAKRAPELHGFVNMQEILKIEKRGWEWVKYGNSIAIGKLNFAHDYGPSGKYAAIQTLAATGQNSIFGHTHRAQCEYGGLVSGERHVAWSMGWLGDYEALAFSYSRRWKARKEWTHGFGKATLDSTGCGWASFVPILDGRCVVEGRVIHGRRVAA